MMGNLTDESSGRRDPGDDTTVVYNDALRVEEPEQSYAENV